MTNQQPVGSPPEKSSLNSVDLGSRGHHYDSLPRSALIRLLQAHDAANAEAGRHGIVMNYTGRTAPWQIIRQVKPKLHRIVKKIFCRRREHTGPK